MATSIDQQFIEYIVKSLVGKPDEVKIERTIDEKGVLLELSVDPEDLGRVIGKRGATAQSLRTLLRALGTKNDARYNLKIVDTGEPPARRTPAKNTDDTNTDEPPSDSTPPDEPAATDDDIVSPDEESSDHESVISKTRKELAELDDLDL
jgi:predicted RNA-binding protein YlqC (UPF0109 family)